MCAHSKKTTKEANIILDAVIMILVCDRIEKELKVTPLDLIMREFVKDLRNKARVTLNFYSKR